MLFESIYYRLYITNCDVGLYMHLIWLDFYLDGDAHIIFLFAIIFNVVYTSIYKFFIFS